MKKFLGILLAGFIGFLSIFTSPVNIKNSAEPQYFRNNTIQNAAVLTTDTENEIEIIDFYFDNINYYGTEAKTINLTSNSNDDSNLIMEIYSYNLNNQLIHYLTYNFLIYTKLEFRINSDLNTLTFALHNVGRDNPSDTVIYTKNSSDNIWRDSNNNPVKGFRITYDINIYTDTEDLALLNPYIGDLTSLPTPETTITQIGNIISDTTNWFVNIFIGLSDVFYSDGQLGVWGSVLFLGVAFTLVSMVLKWVISLIRGI